VDDITVEVENINCFSGCGSNWSLYLCRMQMLKPIGLAFTRTGAAAATGV
jgi:hypothetical protein